MAQARFLKSRWFRSFAARGGRVVVAASLTVVIVGTITGCASLHRQHSSFSDMWDPGLEVRFPGAIPETGDETENGSEGGEATNRVVAAPDRPLPPIHRFVRDTAAVVLWTVDQLGLTVVPRRLKGVDDRGDTTYVVAPGTYAFGYDKPGFSAVYGEASVYPVLMPRARDFIRHGSIALTPGPMGRNSVLSEADLNRARNGDVVTKVIFMAHLPTIHDRLNDIDKGLRELDRVRTSLDEQLAYWNRKLTERRLNTRYSSDFGWGVDVPAIDLALLQAIVGPERYHWRRFSEAEDKVRTYEDKLADLVPAVTRLRKERDGLKQMLNSSDVIHRTTDVTVLSASMIRDYHDPVNEVYQWRGSWGKVHFPYWYSSLSMSRLWPGLRAVPAPSATFSGSVGEVLMVVQLGDRKPFELGGNSWVINR